MMKKWIKAGDVVINTDNVRFVGLEGDDCIVRFSEDWTLRLKGDTAKNVWAYFTAALVSHNLTPAREQSVLGEK